MAAIRPYVSFDFKHPSRLSRRNKVKITKHFNALARFGDDIAIIKLKGKTSAQIEAIRRSLNASYMSVPRSIKHTEFNVLFVNSGEDDQQVRKIKGEWKLVRKRKTGKGYRITEKIRVEADEVDEYAVSPYDWALRRFQEYNADARFVIGNDGGWRLVKGDPDNPDEPFGSDAIAAAKEVEKWYMKYDEGGTGDKAESNTALWLEIDVHYNG